MIRKITVLILGLLSLAIFCILNYRLLQHTLAEKSGRQPVAGLEFLVEVWRNPEGIPSLEARSESDVFRALGYVHAQDRLWQMELLRRAALGKLTEILGEDFLATDQIVIQWQFATPAADNLSFASRQLLEAYCNGINAFLCTHAHRLPPEFSELKFKPEAWQPTHCLAIGRLLGWMNSGLDHEIFLWNLQSLAARYRSLFENERLETRPVAQTRLILHKFSDEFYRQRERLSQLTGLWLRFDFPQPASSEFALVFNPRARLTIPNLFYLQNVKTPEYNVWSATIPGMPFFFAGTNGKIAWILTPPPDRDSRLELEYLPASQLIEKNSFIPTQTDTLVYSFFYLPGRFYLGTVYDSLSHQPVCISLNLNAFRTDDDFAAIPLLHKIGEIDSLQKLISQFSSLHTRLLIADSVHHFTIQPGIANDSRTNGKKSSQTSFAVNHDSLNPILVARILADTENYATIPLAALLRNYLQIWNLTADSASVAATVFNLVTYNLVENIFRDEMGDTLFAQFLELPEQVVPALAQIFATPGCPWIDRITTPDTLETLSEIVKLSFEQAVDTLSRLPLPSAAWGNRTAFQIRHPLARGNARDVWLNPDQIDWRGRGFPENLLPHPGSRLTNFFGSPVVLRFKLKSPAELSWNLSTGQSGHPGSENYRDQTRNWLSDTPRRLIPSRETTRLRQRLILEPLIHKK